MYKALSIHKIRQNTKMPTFYETLYLAPMNFGANSTEAQTTIHGNQTVNGKTMAGNTTANMTKGNSTSMPTPEGPSPP